MTKTILVNKENLIKENYINKVKLITTKDILDKDIQIEEETYQNYLQLKEYLEKKNIYIGIDSSYRTIEEQQKIIDEYTIKYGKDYVASYVAPIRTSEHHTGLAIDISLQINGKYLLENEDLMEKEQLFLEIHKVLHQFGFILRYPKGKENITGYDYEPWHIRYVGEFVASIIYQNHLTLEEYVKDFSGVVVVNKEKGMTSFDVVNEISHLFGIKRVGHTGTLDPLAEGVLIVAIGKATKIVELLTATYKEYIAEVKLGIKTDTLDITGNIIDTKEVGNIENLQEVIESFQKTYLQEVPIYSAVKVNGKKLYQYARNREEVELPKKEVTIKEIELLNYELDTFTFRTLVSKGCYIRSLIRDIGDELEIPATMTKLTRTKQGKVQIKEASTLEEIKNNNYHLYSIEEVLDYPIIEVDKDLEFKIKNGQPLKNIYQIEDLVIFKKDNKLLGIYKNEEDILKVWKNF